jgi:hypothetical protein
MDKPEDCQAIKERKSLTAQLKIAAVPHVGEEDFIDEPGTEEALVMAFDILHGIVNEYKDGGDQMVENCSCGHHTNSLPVQLPFGLVVSQLELDPTSVTGFRPVDEVLEILREEFSQEELKRVLTSAVLLMEANAGTLAQCLDTAIVWERG